LISFFGGTTERSPRERLTQKGKTDDYAVIFSIEGTRFAARVDEPPRMCTDRSALEKTGGNACYMRRKHLERLFELCVARADDLTTSDNTHDTEEHGHGIEREMTATIADPRCAT